MSRILPEIEAYIPALRRHACALLRDRQDADDLVHDCLVRALDRLGTRGEDSELGPWLFAIMQDLFVAQLRGAKSRGRLEPLDEARRSPGSHAAQDDWLRWCDLVRGLDSLPDEQRTVLLLIAVEGLTYADTASVLGIPIGTVMSRLARGRERLWQLTEEGARPSLRSVK